MNSIEKEHRSYVEDVKAIDSFHRRGAPKENVLARLVESFERHSHPEHRAHFLFMASNVLLELHQKDAAYEMCANVERNFPGTLFARVAADRMKLLFVEEGGRFSPGPSFAMTVQVESTNCCDLDCVMCTRSKKRKHGFMRFDTFRNIVDQALSAGAIAIRLYHMGEPFLHKSIVEFVGYFKKRVNECGFEPPCIPRRIGIQTNGMMLNEDLADRIMEAGVDTLAFSIDGRTSREYEKIRQGAVFDRVLANLRSAKRIREVHNYDTRIRVSVLDMALNEEDKVRLNTFYKDNGADSVSFMPCSPAEGRHVVNKDGDLVPAEAVKQENCPSMSKQSEKRRHVRKMGDVDRIVVLWNGDIKASCGEPGPGDILGNIDKMRLIDAYHEKMRDREVLNS